MICDGRYLEVPEREELGPPCCEKDIQPLEPSKSDLSRSDLVVSFLLFLRATSLALDGRYLLHSNFILHEICGSRTRWAKCFFLSGASSRRKV